MRGEGRTAVYYAHSFSANFTPGYLENTSLGITPTPTATPFIPTPPTPQAGWIARSYTYASAHPHAATAAGDYTYAYDASGNMTCRKEEGVTFNQIFNEENRLAEVQNLGTGVDCPQPDTEGTPAYGTWEFTYDGDGNLAKKSYTDTQVYVNLYFSAGVYEERYLDGTLTATLKYYSIAGMTIAMDDGTGLKYLLTDHLGSVVAVTNANGALLSQQRYLPFGDVRTDEFAPGSITQTDLAYTGQRDLPALGLMDYKARFYDPALGRFIQPDTIIPKPENPQSWNRYSYVLNDPVAFADPSGFEPCKGSNWDDGPQCKRKNPDQYNPLKHPEHYGLHIRNDDWKSAGYSSYEIDLLSDLWVHGGDQSKWAVQYLLRNSIHVARDTLHFLFGGATDVAYDVLDSHVLYINANSYPANLTWGGDRNRYAYLLSLIVHETVHIQQGSVWALSVLGEQEAWQVQFREYRLMNGSYPGNVEIADALVKLPLDMQHTEQARALMMKWDPGYRADLLPDLPFSFHFIR